ncbi:hypothetical protein Glove_40g83 [Diversispora epigaea]|uniref:Rx N-terminal domain-containing protein n=1 Tax=Diversispora epigaea TaxID=1348612 RepID=A0A397JMH3_9GLOM|nr:hypothetical protein Glove_40g83 [Diversispora epigaea]
MSCELSCNTHEKLFSVCNLLQEEAIMTQNNVKTWVKHLSVFVKELNTSNRVFPNFAALHYLDEVYLEKLNLEFERLREIM